MQSGLETWSQRSKSQYSPFIRFWRILIFRRQDWATVTVTGSGGRRHSVDVYACSTYDAAHLFVARARGNPESGLPSLGGETQFKVSVAGRIHYVQGAALQRWIPKERHQRK